MVIVNGDLEKNIVEIDDTWNLATIVLNVKGVGNTVKIKSTKKNISKAKIVIDLEGSSSIFIDSDCKVTGRLVLVAHKGSMVNISCCTTFNASSRLLLHEKSRLAIGSGCMIGAGATIQTSDMHSIINKSDGVRINMPKDVVLEDHVWIASKSLVLKGVTIGADSVIGTGAIVTKSVPRNSLAVGVPAKKVKDNISWDRDLL